MATAGGVEAEGAARGPGSPPGAGSTAGLTLQPAGAQGPWTAHSAAAKTRRGRWERSRRSQPTPPRSGRQAGHAQCGRRAAVRQLGSSRSRGRGGENAGDSERRPQAVANFAASAVWRARHLATSNPIPQPYRSDGGCGRQGVPAARPCLASSWGPTGKLLGVGIGKRDV